MSVIFGNNSIVIDGLVFYIDPATSSNSSLENVEVLVVAGGGSGGTGSNGGGGGGAGGLIYKKNVTVDSSVDVTVGSGGAATIGRGVGSDGQNSSFGTKIIASGGGGGGGSGGGTSGRSGGSGGGAMYSDVGGPAVSGQGNNGGTGNYALNGPHDAGGGGGGAGYRGKDANDDYAGHGGDGLCFSITGTPEYYAGGGGGASNGISGGGLCRSGFGGRGGGGRGARTGVTLIGQAGEPNTGGGGGGGSGASGGQSGAGGSGIVVVRYPGHQKATGGDIINTFGGFTSHTFLQNGTFTPSSNLTNGSSITGVKNLSNNANTAVQFNGVTYSTSVGGCLSLSSASNQYLDCGTYPAVEFGFNNFNVSVWFNTPSTSGADWMGIISRYNGGRGWWIQLNPGNRYIAFGWGGSGGEYVTTSTTGGGGVWRHLSCQRTGPNSLEIYLNGVLIGSSSSIPNYNSSDSTYHSIDIGRIDIAGRYFNGFIGQTFLYNKSLSADEIRQNYESTRGRYGV